MTVNSAAEANAKVGWRDAAALTEQEIRLMLLHLKIIEQGSLRRLYAELALRILRLSATLTKSSARLSGRLLFLTWVIAGLTLVLHYMTPATIMTALSGK